MTIGNNLPAESMRVVNTFIFDISVIIISFVLTMLEGKLMQEPRASGSCRIKLALTSLFRINSRGSIGSVGEGG